MEIARATLHELFLYDNGVLRNKQIRGRRAKVGTSVGCRDSYGYLTVTINRKVYKVHRVIYAMFNDTVPDIIDHINGDKADNRIENLRPATAQQNGYNRKVNFTSTTQIKNVHLLEGKWMAQCQANGVRRYLGVYCNIEDAIAAVTKFRDTYHKEFAKHE